MIIYPVPSVKIIFGRKCQTISWDLPTDTSNFDVTLGGKKKKHKENIYGILDKTSPYSL